jgi:hypothetical protein
MDNYTNRTWLYHASGAKVEIALPFGALETAKTIAEYLSAGFTVNMPEGVQKPLHVDYVVRCEFEYKGKKKERLYFYDMTSQYSSSALTLYLDTPEIIAAFEAAAGFTVASMPITRGKAAVTSDSGDYFTQVARAVDFTVNRRKVNVTDENPNGNWELIGYVSANPKTQQQSTPPMTNAPTTIKAFPDRESAKKFIKSWEQDEIDITSDEILVALGVNAYGAYEGTLAQAQAAVNQYLLDKAVAF